MEEMPTIDDFFQCSCNECGEFDLRVIIEQDMDFHAETTPIHCPFCGNVLSEEANYFEYYDEWDD